ncbi:MAG: alpha/beta fold hydrolase [Candidatus Binatia bacterium]
MSISTELGTERSLDLPAGRIEYRETGPKDRPVVLFLHGALVNGDLWRGVAPAVAAEGHRCITPDWPLGSHRVALSPDADLTPPGFAKIVADFIAKLGAGPVTLVANDTGGAMAQIVATRHSKSLARLVLTSCDAFENFFPPRYRPLHWAGYVPAAVWLAMQAFRVPALQFSPIGFGPLVARRIEPRIVESFLVPARTDPRIRHDLAKLLRGVDSRYTLEAAEKLRAFAAPTLVAWSAADPIFPEEHGRRLAGLVQRGTFRLIDGARCFSPEDQPRALADAIVEFLRESAGTGLRPASSVT